MPAPDTFPRLLLEHAQTRGDRPAIREKDLGIWQSHSWKLSVGGAGRKSFRDARHDRRRKRWLA